MGREHGKEKLRGSLFLLPILQLLCPATARVPLQWFLFFSKMEAFCPPPLACLLAASLSVSGVVVVAAVFLFAAHLFEADSLLSVVIVVAVLVIASVLKGTACCPFSGSSSPPSSSLP